MNQAEDNIERLPWRSGDRTTLVPQVQIPRALALDLVRFWCPWTFTEDVGDDEFMEGCAQELGLGHAERMKALDEAMVIELCDQNIPPTADNLLRILSIAYEAAPLIGARGGECRPK